MFLRFICPAIVAPELEGLVSTTPTKEMRRGLLLIAKIIQNLANNVLFGTKEPYMFPLNPFLVQNIQLVTEFLREISVSCLDLVRLPCAPNELLLRCLRNTGSPVQIQAFSILDPVSLCIDSYMTTGIIFARPSWPEKEKGVCEVPQSSHAAHRPYSSRSGISLRTLAPHHWRYLGTGPISRPTLRPCTLGSRISCFGMLSRVQSHF